MKNILQKTDKILTAISNSSGHPMTSAVILAAGESSRFSSEKTKQITEINNMPIVVRSVLIFQKSSLVDEIIIVASEKEIPYYTEYIDKYSLSKVKKVVAGGKSRAESSKNGFFATDKKSKFVLFHDAARCFLREDQAENVIKAAYKYGAAIAAVKSTDTIKRADKDGFISKTIDRKTIWRAQTPQAFLKKLYEISLAKAGEAYIYATDDASIAEASGFKVKLVECGENNIKITYKEDLYRAKYLIEENEEVK